MFYSIYETGGKRNSSTYYLDKTFYFLECRHVDKLVQNHRNYKIRNEMLFFLDFDLGFLRLKTIK
jgi:hypothetical protein